MLVIEKGREGDKEMKRRCRQPRIRAIHKGNHIPSHLRSKRIEVTVDSPRDVALGLASRPQPRGLPRLSAGCSGVCCSRVSQSCHGRKGSRQRMYIGDISQTHGAPPSCAKVIALSFCESPEWQESRAGGRPANGRNTEPRGNYQMRRDCFWPSRLLDFRGDPRRNSWGNQIPDV